MQLIKDFAFVLIALTILSSCGSSDISNTEELINIDIAFSDYSAQNGYGQAFIHFADSNAVLLRDNRYPTRGIDSISEIFNNVNDSVIGLTWQPTEAFVAKSNDLGYTYGFYTVTNIEIPDSIIGLGTYVSVWKKNYIGEWKWVLDCGTNGLPIRQKD